MKKVFYILTISVLLLIPSKVYAANDVSISCGKTKLNKNEETSCTISVNNLNFKATDITGKIKTGNNLSITSSSYDRSVWLSLASNFTVEDLDLMKNEVTSNTSLVIATFKVKASANATGTSTITFDNVAMGNDSYQSIPLASRTVNFSFTSNVNTLSALSVSGANIDFSPDKTTYNLTLDTASVTINATPTHSGARVTGAGNRNLNYGNNAINVVVTAEDGSTKTYTINITRPDKRSQNNNLKSLNVSEGSIKFNKATTSYNVNVEANVTKITISAAVEDSKASFENGYGPRTVNLNYGNNRIQVRVKAENGAVKTYTINVNRKDNRSSNNTLKTLTLSKGKIDFEPNKTDYTITVPNEITSIEVKATAADTKSKVEIIGNNKELVVGENIITIKVTAENQSVKEYKIKVIKEDKVIVTSSNKLKELKVEGYELDFKEDVYSYDLKVKESKLKITATPSDENAKYKITGNDKLKNGSIILITVTDKDGNNLIYKINIEKDEPKKEEKKEFKIDNLPLIISILLNIILLIIIIILLIKRKSKKDDNDDNKPNTPPVTPTPTLKDNKEKKNKKTKSSQPVLEHLEEQPVLNHLDESKENPKNIEKLEDKPKTRIEKLEETQTKSELHHLEEQPVLGHLDSEKIDKVPVITQQLEVLKDDEPVIISSENISK